MAKRKKKTALQLAKIAADDILSVWVREAAWVAGQKKCPLCNIRPIQCCFHIVGRSRTRTRWTAKNVIAACHPCNNQERFYPDISRAWYIRTFGADQYLRLVDESRIHYSPTVEALNHFVSGMEYKIQILRGEK
jgi:hypothetical protein